MNCDYISVLYHALIAYKDLLFNLYLILPLSPCVSLGHSFLLLSGVFVAAVKQSIHKHAVEFSD